MAQQRQSQAMSMAAWWSRPAVCRQAHRVVPVRTREERVTVPDLQSPRLR